jgi:hypothetical protein
MPIDRYGDELYFAGRGLGFTIYLILLLPPTSLYRQMLRGWSDGEIVPISVIASAEDIAQNLNYIMGRRPRYKPTIMSRKAFGMWLSGTRFKKSAAAAIINNRRNLQYYEGLIVALIQKCDNKHRVDSLVSTLEDCAIERPELVQTVMNIVSGCRSYASIDGYMATRTDAIFLLDPDKWEEMRKYVSPKNMEWFYRVAHKRKWKVKLPLIEISIGTNL